MRRVLVVAALVLMLAGCSGGEAKTPASSPVAPTTTSSAAPTNMVTKWEQRLKDLKTDSCADPTTAFDSACFLEMDKVGVAAHEAAVDANQLGYRYMSVKMAAEEAASTAHQWNSTCITSKPNTRERIDCAFQVFPKLRIGSEGILAAIYAVDRP